jgi:hypothetical protein
LCRKMIGMLHENKIYATVIMYSTIHIHKYPYI